MQLTALKAVYEGAAGDLAAARADAAAAAQRCTELQAEQAAFAAAKAALVEQLAAREVAAEEMSATVAALKEDCARLDALNSELREAMGKKVGGTRGRGSRAGSAETAAPAQALCSAAYTRNADMPLGCRPVCLLHLQVAELEREVASLSDERAQLEREADQMQRDMQEMARQLEVQARRRGLEG